MAEDDQRIIDAIRKAVEIRGREYVYQYAPESDTCFYRQPVYIEDDEGGREFDHSEGEPGCIVGLALDLMGVLPERLEPYFRGEGPTMIEQRGAHNIMEPLGLDVSENIRFALHAAQNIQDEGKTWGAALDRFETYP